MSDGELAPKPRQHGRAPWVSCSANTVDGSSNLWAKASFLRRRSGEALSQTCEFQLRKRARPAFQGSGRKHSDPFLAPKRATATSSLKSGLNRRTIKTEPLKRGKNDVQHRGLVGSNRTRRRALPSTTTMASSRCRRILSCMVGRSCSTTRRAYFESCSARTCRPFLSKLT